MNQALQYENNMMLSNQQSPTNYGALQMHTGAPENEMNTLEMETAELEDKNRKLLEEHRALLEEKNRKLLEDTRALREENNSLVQSKGELLEGRDGHTRSIEKYVSDVFALRNRNKILEMENKTLEKRKSTLQGENETLQSEINALRIHNVSLEEVLHRLNSAFSNVSTSFASDRSSDSFQNPLQSTIGPTFNIPNSLTTPFQQNLTYLQNPQYRWME